MPNLTDVIIDYIEENTTHPWRIRKSFSNHITITIFKRTEAEAKEYIKNPEEQRRDQSAADCFTYSEKDPLK